tara:strand:+ start:526 stop:843 length:318 start_codon:yes stop_codon:yes gene_type:complete
MIVETFHDGTTTMNFKGTDGTLLDMTAKNHYITLKFVDKDGNVFEFTSDGYEFTIPGLKLDITGYKLVASDAVVFEDGEIPSAAQRRRMAASSGGSTPVTDSGTD